MKHLRYLIKGLQIMAFIALVGGSVISLGWIFLWLIRELAKYSLLLAIVLLSLIPILALAYLIGVCNENPQD